MKLHKLEHSSVSYIRDQHQTCTLSHIFMSTISNWSQSEAFHASDPSEFAQVFMQQVWLVSPLCRTPADRIRSQIRWGAVKEKAEEFVLDSPLCDLACRCLSFQSLEFSWDQEGFQVQERSCVWISGPRSRARIDWLTYYSSYLKRLMPFLNLFFKKKRRGWFNLIYSRGLIISPAF